MLSDASIADICLAMYDYPDGPVVKWDHLECPKQDDGIKWGLKRVADLDVVVLRGSTTFRDWFRDFQWIANPISHYQLGPIHPGFFDGCDEAWTAITPLLRKPYNYVLCGHSLGAAHAAILTAFGILEKRPPVRRLCWGEPRAGFKQFHDVLASVSTASYQNKGDVIPDLPPSLLGEEYVDSVPLLPVSVKPHGRSLLWGPFAPHHMQLYREAMH